MPTRQLIDWSYTAQQRNTVIAMPKFVDIALSTLPGTNPAGVSAGDCWLAKKKSKLLDISVHLKKAEHKLIARSDLVPVLQPEPKFGLLTPTHYPRFVEIFPPNLNEPYTAESPITLRCE
ncbi:hypothetical protein O164_28635 [Pseudomonas taiwanensis SJ9]|uniref:Uncharacterized protein n=1 Tax=Pseudomonas taiwanensis SJ9 TaxID=1388762 RepID=V7D342_9PSED|nr:hypothetical protein O164_28635 [Pseudomonas taiwanensis SJ9]